MNRNKLLNGVNLLSNTVKVTLGTQGRLVLYNKLRDFEDPIGYPSLTKDGVTVAKHIQSADPVENMAIQIMRQASQNTVDTSGDGTTTTSILAQEIINKGFNLLDHGMSSWEFNRQADQAVADIVKYIEDKSIPINKEGDLSEIKTVATISSNSEELGGFIYDIIKNIGIESDIEVKKSNKSTTEIEMVKGMKIHKGYFAPFFCTDMTYMTWEQYDVNILLFDDTIRDFAVIEPYMRASVDAEGKAVPILIYCEDVADAVLGQLNRLVQMNPRPVMIVEKDGFGDRGIDVMNDIAVVTDALIVDYTHKPKDYRKALGRASEVLVNSKFTTILGGKGNDVEIQAEVDRINERLEADELMSGNERKFLNKRIANLSGGIAVIHVGGTTKIERNEAHDRIEDAVLAVKSAIKSGTSVGGAYIWENCANYLIDALPLRSDIHPNHTEAYKLVVNSLKSILRQLLTNSGELPNIDTIRDTIVKDNKAYNLIDRQFYKIDDYPVRDATSVLIDSIKNAISVAKSILAIERSIYNGEVHYDN